MKNSILPCGLALILLAGNVVASAQKYKGVNIINSKGKLYKEQKKWKHELQFGVKLPNAQAVAQWTWLNRWNINDYLRSASAFSLAYYASSFDKMSFGLELFYDENEKQVWQGSSLQYEEHRALITMLAHLRYCWFTGGKLDAWIWYSDLAVGYGADVTKGTDAYNAMTNNTDYSRWLYGPGLQCQAVFFGFIYGRKKVRAIGELGLGSMYLIKAGINYVFTSESFTCFHLQAVYL